MAHPLGELALVVPAHDAAEPAKVADLERALDKRGIAHRRVPDAHSALATGAQLVVVCGGLRATGDAVAAMVDPATGPTTEAILGLFPGGAPNDFAWTFGLDLAPEATAAILDSPRVMRVDIGVASFDGTGQRLVLNEALIGLGATVAARRRALRGRVGALLAWWTTIGTFRRPRTDIDMTFAEWHDRLVELRVSNGQFAYNHLHIAPMALPDDGAWDVQVWSGPRHLPFTLQPQMVLGEHLPNDHVSQWRQKRVSVTTSRKTRVAIDGLPAGHTPVELTLHELALRLKI